MADSTPGETATGDALPIAQRRKRRASSSLSSPQKAPTRRASNSALAAPRDGTKTPSKPKKRVRFSDPGPEAVASSPASTGITPFVQHTSLEPQHDLPPPPVPRLLARPPRRRASMPSMSGDPASPAEPPSSPVRVHFAPLRQVLSERTQRRLRRNRMSEETNAIETERKQERSRAEEIKMLRQELARAREGLRQGSDQPSETSHFERVQELEQELVTLKTEMHSRAGTLEPGPPTPAADDDVSLIAVHNADMELPLTSTMDTPPETPTAPSPPTYATAAAQTIAAAYGPDAPALEAHIATQTAHLVAARLELERLCPGETALGLHPTGGDAAPVLAALLDRLAHARGALDASGAALAQARTHEANTRAHFDGALRRLEAAHGAQAELGRAAEVREARIAELKREAAERERDAEKLRAALDKYRAEVASLERLVGRVEREGQDAGRRLRAERDEAVADLECQVAAETRGRREAEEESARRALRIRGLEEKERELAGAVHEKQTIVRALEDEVDRARSDGEAEAGRLNVRVAELSQRLEEVRTELAESEAERRQLMERVDVEVREGDRVRSELRGLVEGWERRGAADGEAVVHDGSFGLLTPHVPGGRFRDVASDKVEGKIETKRGRGRKERKVDSGIGILEEDEPE